MRNSDEKRELGSRGVRISAESDWSRAQRVVRIDRIHNAKHLWCPNIGSSHHIAFLESVNLMSKNRIPSSEPLFPRKPAISGAPDVASAPTTAEHEPTPLPEDVPVLHSLGLVKVKRNGWVVVRTFSEGDKITSKEVLSEPENQAVALERFKIACVRTYFPDIIAGKVSCDP